MAKNQGLVVKAIEPGSPADRAGFLPEDVVRRVNGQGVDDIVDLRYHSSEEEFEVEFPDAMSIKEVQQVLYSAE